MIVKHVAIPEEVVMRYACKNHHSYEKAVELFEQLTSFLDAAAFEVLIPSSKIDDLWHEFILHTRQYADFCRKRYGRYVHHVPNSYVGGAPSQEDEGDDKPGEGSKEKCSSGILKRYLSGEKVVSPNDDAPCASDCRSGGDD